MSLKIRYKYRVLVPDSYDITEGEFAGGKYWYTHDEDFTLEYATQQYEEFVENWGKRQRGKGSVFIEKLDIQIQAVLESEWEAYKNQDHEES